MQLFSKILVSGFLVLSLLLSSVTLPLPGSVAIASEHLVMHYSSQHYPSQTNTAHHSSHQSDTGSHTSKSGCQHADKVQRRGWHHHGRKVVGYLNKIIPLIRLSLDVASIFGYGSGGGMILSGC